MSEEKKVVQKLNLSVDHQNQAFFSDRVVVSHVPNKFLIDFTQATPRFDLIGDQIQQTIVVKHNTLIMDPVTVKDFVGVLEDNIKKYEKSYEKIVVPKQPKSKEKAISVEPSSSKYIG